nr:hypothetical protein [Tanacetum cinerariifolium]
KVHFHTLVNKEKVDNFDCVLPGTTTAKIMKRFEKINRNDEGVYLFKFAYKAGMDQVLEKGSWLICKSPIILNKRIPSVSLKKGEVTKVLVWVKLYNVPILAYSEDGLSLIATQIVVVPGRTQSKLSTFSLLTRGVMERGFLDNSDKKKKEGGSKVNDDEIPILDSVNKVNVADAGKLNANSSSPTTDIRNLGPRPAGLANNEAIYAPKIGTLFASVVSPNAKNSAAGSSNAKYGGSNPSVPAGMNMDNSYASLVRPSVTTKVHFHTLVNKEKVDNFDCVLPRMTTAKIMKRYDNSIVGFFLGKDLSFLVVQQFVMNTWRKFRFEKITRNDEGVYLFKFAYKAGMDQVLEKGPWLICKSPIILNKRIPSVSLKKGEVTKVLVWVKLYNVPILAYSEDGLSLIATQIGKPIMLDAFTSSMCVES